MTGFGYRQASELQGGSKRVPRPFDQADIDGELVEHERGAHVPFFIPAQSPQDATSKERPDTPLAEAAGTTGRYGDVSSSSIGDDSERERDA